MPSIKIFIFFAMFNLALLVLLFYVKMQDKQFNLIFNSEYEKMVDMLTEYHESFMGMDAREDL